jgi:hypothetical protein
MSLVFKPKIADVFEGKRSKRSKEVKKVKRKKPRSWLAIQIDKPKGKKTNAWSPEELNMLVDLRAMNTSVFDCARLIKRDTDRTRAALHSYNLYPAIKAKRLMLVRKIIENA